MFSYVFKLSLSGWSKKFLLSDNTVKFVIFALCIYYLYPFLPLTSLYVVFGKAKTKGLFIPTLQPTLREKCPNTEFFWSFFSRIWTEHRDLLRKYQYSVQMWENTDQKSSVFEQFLHSAIVTRKSSAAQVSLLCSTLY